jgi:hydroxypyruvate reductase
MVATAARILGSRIRAGLVVTSAGTAGGNIGPPFETLVGGHPVPTADSERAGRRAVSLAAGLKDDETLVVLLSGGASALMAAPADGVTLDDKRQTTAQLLRAGADIHALNTVRKHLSAIKGGWLAARASGPCHTFAVSDVVGDDLSAIGSGPTVADATTFADALAIVQRFGGAHAYPPGVIARLEAGTRGDAAETPKPGDARLARAVSAVIGGRHDAMDGAARHAASLGYHVVRIEDPVIGEARTAAPAHLRAIAARSAGEGRPLCVVSSGETTVRVVGAGKGGRNQEFALAAAAPLASLPEPGVVASVGTDGIDGPTDAAGALVDSTTLSRAAASGLTPAHYLDDNNAYAFFEALGDLIHTGPTGTNVGDLQVILLA